MEWLTIKVNPVDYDGDIVCKNDDPFDYGFNYRVVTKFDRQGLMMSDEEFNDHLISNGLVYWGKL
jgi:hypothetical protein